MSIISLFAREEKKFRLFLFFVGSEYITMGIAISAGEREFDTIVAAHEKATNGVIAPCGNCRQMLVEYCPDIKVILNDDSGNLIKVGATDLLPFAWKPVVC